MALPELRLRIDAHADARGSEPLNKRLSRRRAEAVVGFLRDAGVAPGRMQAHCHGEQRHGYARQDREGMGFDRHVLIRLELEERS
ncbi:MAG: OmpA family protein [Candidatus Sedimenticola endophacoides]